VDGSHELPSSQQASEQEGSASKSIFEDAVGVTTTVLLSDI